MMQSKVLPQALHRLVDRHYQRLLILLGVTREAAVMMAVMV
jgi:hypothetical protein